MNSEKAVHWNLHEKIIGVVGVAPSATVDFYSKLVNITPAKKDWEHVRVVIDSNPKIPSRGRYIELNEADPVPGIRQSIEELMTMGAQIIAIPCNTAHILFDRYSKNFAVHIPNIIEETVKYLHRVCEKRTRKILVLASKLTQEYRLYGKFIEPLGGEVIDVSKYQPQISLLIEKVKQGYPLAPLKKQMCDILSVYHKYAEACVIGCTELSLLLPKNSQIPIIDSNLALAHACLLKSGNISYLSCNASP